jgi:hypothetical protein
MTSHQLKYPPLPPCPTHRGNPCANAGALTAVSPAPAVADEELNLNFYSRAAGLTFAPAKTRVALTAWRQ